MGKINYTIEGFLKEAEYSSHMHSFFKDYENKFNGADSIFMDLSEIPYTMLSNERSKAIDISEGGKVVRIKYFTSKYYDRVGKVTSLPNPESIFKSLTFLMDKAVAVFDEKVQKSNLE